MRTTWKPPLATTGASGFPSYYFDIRRFGHENGYTADMNLQEPAIEMEDPYASQDDPDVGPSPNVDPIGDNGDDDDDNEDDDEDGDGDDDEAVA